MLSLGFLLLISGGLALSPEEIVRAVNLADTTWQAKLNEGAGSFRGCVIKSNKDRPNPIDYDALIRDEDVPEQFDARVQWPHCAGVINTIRDQSECGSCWAISTAEVISDRYCILENKTISISARDLLSCALGYACSGGNPIDAFDWWIESGAVTGGLYNSSEGCQPYPFPPCMHHMSPGHKYPYPDCPKKMYDDPSCSHECTNKNYKKSFKDDLHFGLTSYSLNGVKQMQKELMLHGSIIATFDVYADFEHYTGGVYRQTSPVLKGGHAVRVIGWGSAKVKGVDTPYWLIANSWNKFWGEHGYVRFLRGANECNIETGGSAGLPKYSNSIQ